MKRIIFIFTFSLLMPQAENLSASTDLTSPAKVWVVFKEDALTVHAENVSSTQVLQSIQKELGFETILQGDLPEESEDWSFHQVPFLEAIRHVVGNNHLFAILYDASEPPKVLKLWIFEESLDETDDLRASRLDPFFLLTPEPVSFENPASENSEASTNSWNRGQAKLEKLGDHDPSVRLQVVNRLGENSAEWVIPVLGQVLFSESDSEVRLAAVEALKNRDSEAASEFLKVAMRDENKRVRQVAMKNLR